MYYSIYPKLRAIYSYLPTNKDLEFLIESRGLSGLNRRLKELKILKRFPLMDNDVERHFKNIPFYLTKVVYNRLYGYPREFFSNYQRVYELKDIKSALHRKKGNYLIFKEKDEFTLSEIEQYLRGGFWWNAWIKGFQRYKDTEKYIDIEVSLDNYYYQNLYKNCYKLPKGDVKDTEKLILKWVNLKNEFWIYRLRIIYKKETFEIKRFLIPEGDIYENIEEIDGKSKEVLIAELFRTCYEEFKIKMYKMSSIIAFFVLLDLTIDKVLSIYNAKLLNLEDIRTKDLIGIF
jgi:hypothetical protein